MSAAEPAAQPARAPAAAPPSRAEPVCLATGGGDDALAMLHRATAPGRGTAVLVCPPFGWQEVCAYRSLRVWARDLAAAGYPAARLTLPSTGDSAGGHADPARLDAWTEAVASAAAWLRETVGAGRLAVIGIGLGGMLAYRAQAQGAPIDDLVLWGVPARGRTLLRELRGLARVIAALYPEDDRAEADGEGPLDLVGYAMSRQTAAALSDLDLTALPPPGAGRRVLLLGRDGISPDTTPAGGEAEVEVRDGGDWAELMANPQQSRAPRATMALTLEWLDRGPEAQPGPAAASPRQRTSVRCRAGERPLQETPLWLDGVHGQIFGVLTRATDSPAAVGAVLVGAGAVPHTGPNRSWVELARRWAALGVPTLRIDLGGVGESDGEDPQLLTDISFHAPFRDREIELILDQLQAMGVAERFLIGGLCSGAYVAVRRGLADERVAGLLLVNLYAFEWSYELMVERDRWARISTELPQRGLRSIDRELLRRVLRHARPDRAWRLLTRAPEREQRRRATAALDELRRRDVETLVFLSQDEPLLAQFDGQGLAGKLGRWPNVTLVRGASRDHMFRALWYQDDVHAAMDETVRRTLRRHGRGPSARA